MCLSPGYPGSSLHIQREKSYTRSTSSPDLQLNLDKMDGLYQLASVAAGSKPLDQIDPATDVDKSFNQHQTVDPNPANFGARPVHVELCNHDMWSNLAKLGAEMIVTKAGR